MQSYQPDIRFDIDIDLSPILGSKKPLYLSSDWYCLWARSKDRTPKLQQQIDRSLHQALLQLEWQAALAKAERRDAQRIPFYTRVEVNGTRSLVACDLSLTGVRCVGLPHKGSMDIEFSIPTLDFPIEARVEVARCRSETPIPQVGLRFTNIDPVYQKNIARFIHMQQQVRVA